MNTDYSRFDPPKIKEDFTLKEDYELSLIMDTASRLLASSNSTTASDAVRVAYYLLDAAIKEKEKRMAEVLEKKRAGAEVIKMQDEFNVLERDDCGHLYVIPAGRREEFDNLLNDGDLEISIPEWVRPVNGPLSLVRFKNFEIGKED